MEAFLSLSTITEKFYSSFLHETVRNQCELFTVNHQQSFTSFRPKAFLVFWGDGNFTQIFAAVLPLNTLEHDGHVGGVRAVVQAGNSAPVSLRRRPEFGTVGTRRALPVQDRRVDQPVVVRGPELTRHEDVLAPSGAGHGGLVNGEQPDGA